MSKRTVLYLALGAVAVFAWKFYRDQKQNDLANAALQFQFRNPGMMV